MNKIANNKITHFFRTGIIIILLSLLFLMPFGTFLIQLIKFSFSQLGHPLSDLMIKIVTGWKELFLITGLFFALIICILKKRLPFKLSKFDFYLIALMGFGVIYSWLLSPKPIQLVFGFRYDFLVFLFYFLARTAIINKQQFLKLIKVLLIIFIPIAIFGISQTFLLPKEFLESFGYSNIPSPTGNPLPPYHLVGEGIVRAMATFAGPNSLAMYSVLIFLLVLFLGYFLNNQGLKIGLLILSGLTLILTFSRAHLLSLIVSLILGFLFFKYLSRARKDNRIKNYSWVWVGISLAVFIVILLSTFAVANMAQNSQKSSLSNILFREYSTVGHLLVRQQAFEGIRTKPFGHGLGTAGLATTNTGGIVFNPESWIVQIVFELGIFGLVALLLMLYYLYYLFSQIYYNISIERNKQFLKYFVYSFFAIILSVNSLPAWYEVGSIIWWVLFGIYVSNYQNFDQ